MDTDFYHAEDYIIYLPQMSDEHGFGIFKVVLTKTIKTLDCWQTLRAQSICLSLPLREQALYIQP